MKKCIRCEKDKEFSEFNKNKHKKDGFHNYCRKCSNEITSKNYYLNKDKHISQVKKNNIQRKIESRKVVDEFKKNGCSVCSEKDESCLDFHHLDPKTKKHSVAKLANGTYSVKTVLEEIKKCIVLCANCHRKYHANKITLVSLK